jgi:hypothetical protein
LSHYYRFNPPIVSQGDAAKCWAAALESWLACVLAPSGKVQQIGMWHGWNNGKELDGTEWLREKTTTEKLIVRFSQQLTPDTPSLKPGVGDDGSTSLGNVAIDIGMRLNWMWPDAFPTYEALMAKLKTDGHLYLTYFSNTMRHAVVVYGVSTTDGIAVMDPKEPQLVHRKREFFTERPKTELISIGWAAPL